MDALDWLLILRRWLLAVMQFWLYYLRPCCARRQPRRRRQQQRMYCSITSSSSSPADRSPRSFSMWQLPMNSAITSSHSVPQAPTSSMKWIWQIWQRVSARTAPLQPSWPSSPCRMLRFWWILNPRWMVRQQQKFVLSISSLGELTGQLSMKESALSQLCLLSTYLRWSQA